MTFVLALVECVITVTPVAMQTVIFDLLYNMQEKLNKGQMQIVPHCVDGKPTSQQVSPLPPSGNQT